MLVQDSRILDSKDKDNKVHHILVSKVNLILVNKDHLQAQVVRGLQYLVALIQEDKAHRNSKDLQQDIKDHCNSKDLQQDTKNHRNSRGLQQDTKDHRNSKDPQQDTKDHLQDIKDHSKVHPPDTKDLLDQHNKDQLQDTKDHLDQDHSKDHRQDTKGHLDRDHNKDTRDHLQGIPDLLPDTPAQGNKVHLQDSLVLDHKANKEDTPPRDRRHHQDLVLQRLHLHILDRLPVSPDNRVQVVDNSSVNHLDRLLVTPLPVDLAYPSQVPVLHTQVQARRNHLLENICHLSTAKRSFLYY